jgi:hypothetical protein
LIHKIFGSIEEKTKKRRHFFSFVNPNTRQWIFLPTKEILIPVSGLEIKRYNPIPIPVSYLLHCCLRLVALTHCIRKTQVYKASLIISEQL